MNLYFVLVLPPNFRVQSSLVLQCAELIYTCCTSSFMFPLDKSKWPSPSVEKTALGIQQRKIKRAQAYWRTVHSASELVATLSLPTLTSWLCFLVSGSHRSQNLVLFQSCFGSSGFFESLCNFKACLLLPQTPPKDFAGGCTLLCDQLVKSQHLSEWSRPWA